MTLLILERGVSVVSEVSPHAPSLAAQARGVHELLGSGQTLQLFVFYLFQLQSDILTSGPLYFLLWKDIRSLNHVIRSWLRLYFGRLGLNTGSRVEIRFEPEELGVALCQVAPLLGVGGDQIEVVVLLDLLHLHGELGANFVHIFVLELIFPLQDVPEGVVHDLVVGRLGPQHRFAHHAFDMALVAFLRAVGLDGVVEGRRILEELLQVVFLIYRGGFLDGSRV